MSDTKKELNDELIKMSYIPPKWDMRPVFKKGGYLYRELFRDFVGEEVGGDSVLLNVLTETLVQIREIAKGFRE